MLQLAALDFILNDDIKSLQSEKKKKKKKCSTFKICHCNDVSKQPNGFDCGVYIIMHMQGSPQFFQHLYKVLQFFTFSFIQILIVLDALCRYAHIIIKKNFLSIFCSTIQLLSAKCNKLWDILLDWAHTSIVLSKVKNADQYTLPGLVDDWEILITTNFRRPHQQYLFLKRIRGSSDNGWSLSDDIANVVKIKNFEIMNYWVV